MSNDKNSKISHIVESFKDKFKDNLFAVISVGSLTTSHYMETWSDTDLLIVLEQLSLADKVLLADLKSFFEKKYNQRFGINVITKQEALMPIIPEVTLDGKTLQGLLELSVYPDRLVYCKDEKISLFVPNKKTVQTYSLSNIAMFLLRNRKILTSQSFGDSEFKAAVEKEMRAAFIMTRLAVQYKSDYICEGYKDIIQKAKNEFPSFNFDILETNEETIRRWEPIRTRKELQDILDKTDKYIESFAKFIFDQTKN